MNSGIRSMVVLAGLIAAHGMLAQAPAGAPAGSNGICKDGSYSTAASKAGACRGHKGVQTWFGAMTEKPAKTSAASASPKSAPTPVAYSPAPAPAAPAMPAKPSAQIAAPRPAAPMQNTTPMTKSATTQAPASRSQLAQMAPAPGGGNGMVWVNTASKVYHCEGTTYYGKTKAGAYMSEADASAKGARPDAGKLCAK